MLTRLQVRKRCRNDCLIYCHIYDLAAMADQPKVPTSLTTMSSPEKRKEQNRNAQRAFRKRKKEQMDLLRAEAGSSKAKDEEIAQLRAEVESYRSGNRACTELLPDPGANAPQIPVEEGWYSNKVGQGTRLKLSSRLMSCILRGRKCDARSTGGNLFYRPVTRHNT